LALPPFSMLNLFMKPHERILKIGGQFKEYVSLLAGAIGHADRVGPLEEYCSGLFLPIRRKSVEPVAAVIDPGRTSAKHQSLLHFVGNAPWSDEAVLDVVTGYVLPSMRTDAEELSWIMDDTGMPKKGKHSVGVAHMYCGQLGKQANCQVAVSLSIATEEASLPIAHRLYLPKSWAEDPERREKTKVPADIRFLTKPEIALQQIDLAIEKKLPRGIVNADAGYGNGTEFRDALTKRRLKYIVGVLPTMGVWPQGTGPLPPKPHSGTGRPPTRARRDEDHQPITAKDLAFNLQEKFRTVTWREGAKGKMSSCFTSVRVRPSHGDDRGKVMREEEWLLVEWPDGESEPTKYWLSTLPKNTSLRKLVARTKLRWRIGRDYQELKQEVGFGDYEGRGWIGFHHHATLCIASYGFLVAARLFSPSGRSDPRRELALPTLPEGLRPRGSPRQT